MTKMMKSITAVSLAMILVFSLMPLSALAAGQAVRFELDGLEYIGNDEGLDMIYCRESAAGENIVIPEKVTYQGKTYTVTGIGSGAFYDLGEGFSIKSVTIPASVGYIGPAAFKNCRMLEQVTFAAGSVLTELTYEVFADCYTLKSINIPDGVTSIGDQAFYYCYELRRITLPDGLSGIGEKAFFNTVLPAVTIPASVESIGTEALRTYQYLDLHSFHSERALKTVCYQGSRNEWNTLVAGKDIGIGSAAVYTKATITFDTLGQGTAPDPVTIDPLSRPSSIVGAEGPYVIDGTNAVEGWYEDEALTKPFDFDALLTDDVTVYAKWGDRKYTVTVKTVAGAAVDASRYTLFPDGTNMFLPGTNVSVTFLVYNFPDLSGALLDGVRLKSRYARGRYSFTMPHHDAVVTVVTESDPSYPVTVQREPENGGNAYTPDVKSAIKGEKVQVKQWAFDDYRFKEWRATGGVVVDEDGYFTMPDEEVTVTAVYEPEYTVIWLNGDGSRLMSAVYYGDEEEPVTDLIPEKADEGSYSYTFQGWDEGTVSGNTKTYTPVFSRNLKDIPLWLGDTQVTSENLDDIPSVTDGKASFDPETDTLTLDNVRDIRGEYSDAILVSGLSKLTVRMIGNSRFDSFIRNSASSDWLRAKGIVTTGDLSFTDGGEGSLSLTDFEQAIVMNGGDLTVGSGTVSCSMYGHVFESIDDDNGVIECDEMILSGGSLSIDALCHARGTPYGSSSSVDGGDDTYSLNGIVCRSFTMTGGSLNSRNASTAVDASAFVRIEGGQVGFTYTRDVGIYAPQITFSGTDTDVNISTSNCAVYATSSLTLSDEVAIISPEGAYTGSGTIWQTGGKKAGTARIATKTFTVTVETGGFGETITVPVKYGSRFFDAMDGAGVFDTLNGEENADVLFRDLATKPLSEFADETEFGADAEALLKSTVTSDMTVYACFYQKIRTVSLTLEKPVVGATVTVTETDDRYFQNPTPVIILPDDAHCFVSEDSAAWFVTNDAGEYSFFEGSFKQGETYCAEFLLVPEFGYWLDDDTVVTANGAVVEESYGRMTLYVNLATQALSPALLGDADGDGTVTVLDATAVQRYLASYTVSNPEIVVERGDIAGDGIDILDATMIQRYLAGYTIAYDIGKPIQ